MSKDNAIQFLKSALGDKWRVGRMVVDYEHDAIYFYERANPENNHKIFWREMEHKMNPSTGLWSYKEIPRLQSR